MVLLPLGPMADADSHEDAGCEAGTLDPPHHTRRPSHLAAAAWAAHPPPQPVLPRQGHALPQAQTLIKPEDRRLKAQQQAVCNSRESFYFNGCAGSPLLQMRVCVCVL